MLSSVRVQQLLSFLDDYQYYSAYVIALLPSNLLAQITLSRGIVEMVVDGGGHFSPALYRWFTHMSLLLSSSTAHSRAVGTPHTQ